MIISDLQHIESVTETEVKGGFGNANTINYHEDVDQTYFVGTAEEVELGSNWF